MAMNLVRTGAALGIGVASEMLDPARIAPLSLAGQTIGYDAIVEAVAVVGGSVMQFMAPYTWPSVVDGLVTGGIALLGRRATQAVIARPATPIKVGGYMLPAARIAPNFSNVGSRPLVGNTTMPHREPLT